MRESETTHILEYDVINKDTGEVFPLSGKMTETKNIIT